MPYDMSKLPPSPYAHLPYEEKVAATQALIKQRMELLKVKHAGLMFNLTVLVGGLQI
jgi:hypothetical protein